MKLFCLKNPLTILPRHLYDKHVHAATFVCLPIILFLMVAVKRINVKAIHIPADGS